MNDTVISTINAPYATKLSSASFSFVLRDLYGTYYTMDGHIENAEWIHLCPGHLSSFFCEVPIKTQEQWAMKNASLSNEAIKKLRDAFCAYSGENPIG